MLDQRGGAFTLGLGLVRGVAVVPASRGSEERRSRTLSLADTPVVELPTGSALLRRAATVGSWSATPTVHGDLPERHVSVISTRSTMTSSVGVSPVGRRQGEDRLGDVEALGDLSEHDVAAEGVEVGRRSARR